MKKRDLLIQGLVNDKVLVKGNIEYPWLIGLMSVTRNRKDSQPPEPKAYGYYIEDKIMRAFIPTDNDLEEVVIEDYKPGVPLFHKDELITIQPNEVPNYKENTPLITTVGNLIANVLCLCYGFGSKIPYINDRFNPGDIEDMIKTKLHDNPKEGTEPSQDPNVIYVYEYIRFTDGVGFLTNLDGVVIPSITAKALSGPPDTDKLRNELLAKNSDKMDQLTTLIDIHKTLSDHDIEYLKDDPSTGVLINKDKDFRIVRSRMFMTHGHGNGFDDFPEYISKPLSHGYDLKDMPKWVNISRAGTYSRGAETQLGGTGVKEALRATNNLSRVDTDCGTNFGEDVLLDEAMFKKLQGYTAIQGNKAMKIDAEFKGRNLGKRITVRRPHYCKSPGESYCPQCLGPKLSLHKNGLSSSIVELSSQMMYLMMKAMHGKVPKATRMEYKRLIS